MTYLYDKELELETLSIKLGVERYQKAVEEAKAHNNESTLSPQQRLMKRSILPMSLAITTFVDDVLGGKAKRKARAAYLLDGLNPDMVAFLTAQSIFNGISSRQKISSTITAISKAIDDHLFLEAFEKQNPALFKRLDQTVTSHLRHRMIVMRKYAAKAGVDYQSASFEDKVILAEFLIELFITNTGLAMKKTSMKFRKSSTYVVATDECVEWINKAHGQAEVLNPVYMPMVIKPRPWTDPTDGGYECLSVDMVKSFNKGYQEELKHVQMPTVYSAINAVQETAWRINTRVLGVMQEAWEAYREVGKLPNPDGEELPPLPAEDMEAYKAAHPEAFKEWKHSRTKTYSKNASNFSKVLGVHQKLYMAEQFAEYDAIYFPHTLDWRGRMYPVVPYLNPQSDGIGKALLMFSEGVPLTERGVYWLKIHLANSFGVDKVSFDERIKWVDEHSAAISMCALDPMTFKFWEDADKPWLFLAAAFEFEDYKQNGLGTLTHLPVALDGSNNGLQHLAAMRLDAVGGAVVNLVPNQKPADSYAEVAKVVERKLQLDDDPKAVFWRGKVDRGVTKRNVMTLCYGATNRGMLEQLKLELKKRHAEGKSLIDLDDDDAWEYVSFLAKVIQQSIGEVVVAARLTMDWLQDTAKVVASNNLPIHWVTPAGFPVLQAYKVDERYKIHTKVGGIEINRLWSKPTLQIDKYRQALGVSPNVVHSLDSAHLQLTVNELAVDYHLTSFAMIHDSYGTHAGEATDKLARVLREQFVTMYQADVLGNFLAQLREQLPEELYTKLKPLPPTGDLDLEAILDSRYFFA